jgi:hypothetical protein
VVVCGKKQRQCLPEELEIGDCWIALSLAQLSGLILCGRVSKHTDSLAIELVASTQGKTECKEWGTDGWQGDERVVPNEIDHYMNQVLTQRLERTNGSYGNRPDGGTDDKTNLVRCGSKRKSPYVWSSATSTGFGYIPV